MGLMDDYYEMMDPLGVYDLDGDGHYDMDERFLIDEEERMLYEDSISKSTSSLCDDEYDDDIISEYDDSILADDLCEDDDLDKELSDNYEYGGGTYHTQSSNYPEIKSDTKPAAAVVQQTKKEDDVSLGKMGDGAVKVMTFIISVIILSLLCVIPVGLIFAATGSTDMIWLVFVISFLISIPLTVYVMKEAEKEEKKKKGV